MLMFNTKTGQCKRFNEEDIEHLSNEWEEL